MQEIIMAALNIRSMKFPPGHGITEGAVIEHPKIISKRLFIVREIWYSKSVETSSGTQIPLLLDLAFASNVHYLDTVKSHKIFFVHSITIKKIFVWMF